MATERTTRNQRRLLVWILGVATGLAVILGILALGAGGESTSSAARTGPATRAARPSSWTRPATSRGAATRSEGWRTGSTVPRPPGPAGDDDDDATVGPQTAYRAGYVQGWCDGGGVQTS